MELHTETAENRRTRSELDQQVFVCSGGSRGSCRTRVTHERRRAPGFPQPGRTCTFTCKKGSPANPGEPHSCWCCPAPLPTSSCPQKPKRLRPGLQPEGTATVNVSEWKSSERIYPLAAGLDSNFGQDVRVRHFHGYGIRALRPPVSVKLENVCWIFHSAWRGWKSGGWGSGWWDSHEDFGVGVDLRWWWGGGEQR